MGSVLLAASDAFVALDALVAEVSSMKFIDGQTVTIFVDGFGELDTTYDAATDEFVCEEGRFDRASIEKGSNMTGIVENTA